MHCRANAILTGIVAICLLLLPASAHAQTAGGVELALILTNLLEIASDPVVLVAVATIVVIILGLRVLLSNDDSGTEKARKGISAVFVGSVLMMLANTIAILLYNSVDPISALNTKNYFNREILGFSDWIAGIAASLGLLMIIISALRAVLSFGDEDAYKKVRTSVLYAVVGLFIIALDKIFLVTAILNGSAGPIVDFVVRQLEFLLGFVTLIALIVIIYAGIRLVANFGNENVYEESKGIILRAVTGLIVISLSFTAAQFVVSLFS